MTALAAHPAAEIFPLLDGEEFQALKANIAARGLIEPIWLYEGKILDGRNRYRACLELGIEAQFREWTGTDQIAFVWSLNGVRRHLSKSQLALIAVKMLGPLKEEAKKRQEAGRNQYSNSLSPELDQGCLSSGRAVAQAAKIVGVGRTTIEDAKVVTERRPDLIPRIEAGELSVVKAMRIAKGGEVSPRPFQSKQPRAQRVAEITRLAGQGNRTEQIAEELGIGVEQIRYIAREESIHLPDAHFARSHKINARRVIEETVNGLSGYVIGLRTINVQITTIAPADAREWAASLTESLTTLQRLRKQLLEIAHGKA